MIMIDEQIATMDDNGRDISVVICVVVRMFHHE